jgi:hypothetical protein
MTRASVWGLDPAKYERHALHGESSAWVEKNCYIDLWIELLHAAKLEPTAMLGFTLAGDFDGEQWTFYKPPHLDILNLYGVDVQEMSVFKPLLEHALFHAGHGRLVLTEADAFWMPDTRGTDYRSKHTKTTIGIESVDSEAKRLRYFHNAGYYELEGEDFERLFRLGAAPDPEYLPLFAELANFERKVLLSGSELRRRSREQLGFWLSRRPRTNPLERFGQHLSSSLEELRARGLDYYHAFAFATVRQCGSSFELAAHYLRWLDAEAPSPSGYAAAATELEAISSSCKALILKGARAVNSKKPADFSELFDGMSKNWQSAMAALEAQA